MTLLSADLIYKMQNKLLKSGVTGLIQSGVFFVAYKLFCILPINEKRILFESDGDLCDNAFALYEYIHAHAGKECFDIVWFVYDVEAAKKRMPPETHFICKDLKKTIIKKAYFMATCRWYIYDHINFLDKRKRKGQIVVYLSHGCGFKAVNPQKGYVSNIDRCYVTGKMYIPLLAKSQACSTDVVKDLGYPRLDYFFKPISEKQEVIARYFGLKNYRKVLLWMPTFRKSIREDLSETYFDSLTGLPLLEQEGQLREFDRFLQENNCLCLLKIHHLQAELPTFKKRFSNLLILDDEMIAEQGLQLYQVICLTDVLITDYSSVSNDYLLLNKPIIYTLDDYEKYKASRGFKIDDPIKYYVGHHAYNQTDLHADIAEILKKGDVYREDRKKTISEMHTFTDGNASERISRDLGLL